MKEKIAYMEKDIADLKKAVDQLTTMVLAQH
jgi:hypothetical protein